MKKHLAVAFLICCLSFESRQALNQRLLVALELSLDGALEYDSNMNLTLGTDFLSPKGTVIFLSKDEGMRRMVEFARKNELEFGMIFLPEWNAWITESVRRLDSFLILDSKYMTAACSAGIKTGIGHIHNTLEIDIEPLEEYQGLVIQSTMPSDIDLMQFDSVTRDCPYADIFGFITHVFGVTYYAGSERGWAIPEYVHFAVKQEAIDLNRSARRLSSELMLPTFTEGHKGFVRLWFEFLPQEKDSK